MRNDRAAGPDMGASVFVDTAFRTRSSSARLLPAAAAFTRFGPELAKLSRMVDPATAMTVSPAWWQAVPPPRGYANRLLILHQDGELCAAICLRERTMLGFPTGILHGSDVKGEMLVLSMPGREAEWLGVALLSAFRSRRCIALLLNNTPESGFHAEAMGTMLAESGLQYRREATQFFWQTPLCASFDDSLGPMGHRTRRNLRHGLRRVSKNGWEFLPELTPAQVSEATASLAKRSTHPYPMGTTTARLSLELSQENSFSMGLRTVEGEWLSVLSGVRRPGGFTDVFWQANVGKGHESVAITMRALLMRHEGERGSEMLRYIGGTSPLMEHCCRPDPGTQTMITRPGLRLALLRRLLGTRLASAANPMKRLLAVKP